MKKWIFEILDTIKEYKLLFCFSLLSVSIAICCIWIIGTDISDIFCLPLKDKSNILRNILLGLGALIAVPFLVWQNTTSHKALHETKENNQNTQKNNDRTQEAKMYIDCITQLANEKETIRTAAIHGLHELIKNTKDDSLKEKIFNILWSFMVEHSKKCIKINDEIENFVIKTEEDNKIKEDLQTKLEVEQENIEKFYSQFKIILEILATYKDKTHEQTWWKDKFTRKIWLHKIDLRRVVLKNVYLRDTYLKKAQFQGANLEGAMLQGATLEEAQLKSANLEIAILYDVDLKKANLQCAKLKNANLEGVRLQDADLQNSELQGANLQKAKLQSTDLTNTKLQGADLRNSILGESPVSKKLTSFLGVYYNSKPWIDPDTEETYQPTQFSENFDPKACGMIDVSEEKS